jgi:2-hydroxy-3-keto-5-methylthiopentenyl-1-phosphate phosphatase
MTPTEKHRRMVFCDFDGTITVEETFLGMLRHYATEDFDTVERLLTAGRLTIREGVRRLVESIPSRRYPEVLAYIRDQKIRPGLEPLLDFLEGQRVPFVIISGGLLDLVMSRLEFLAERFHAVYAAGVLTDGEFLKVVSDFEGTEELVAKARVMSRYDCEEAVAIGNGMTDVNMALQASVVYARGNLIQHLQARGRTYKAWDDFFDIRDDLAKSWRTAENH